MSHRLTDLQRKRLRQAVRTISTPTLDILAATLVEDDGDERLLDALAAAKAERERRP